MDVLPRSDRFEALLRSWTITQARPGGFEAPGPTVLQPLRSGRNFDRADILAPNADPATAGKGIAGTVAGEIAAISRTG
jgi:hypothetical protein